MSNMMCAIRSGCFTDYFLSPGTVIRIMEAIAATETDARREMLTVEAERLLVFLPHAENEAIRQVRTWGVDLADSPDAEDSVENFLSWFHNMQTIRDSGELGEFTSQGYRDQTQPQKVAEILLSRGGSVAQTLQTTRLVSQQGRLGLAACHF